MMQAVRAIIIGVRVRMKCHGYLLAILLRSSEMLHQKFQEAFFPFATLSPVSFLFGRATSVVTYCFSGLSNDQKDLFLSLYVYFQNCLRKVKTQMDWERTGKMLKVMVMNYTERTVAVLLGVRTVKKRKRFFCIVFVHIIPKNEFS